MAGIKDTQEALEGMLKLSLKMWRIFGDGAQFSDISAMLDAYKNDPEFVTAMSEAYDGYKNIQTEVKDLDATEIFALASVMMSYAPKFIEELKKGD